MNHHLDIDSLLEQGNTFNRYNHYRAFKLIHNEFCRRDKSIELMATLLTLLVIIKKNGVSMSSESDINQEQKLKFMLRSTMQLIKNHLMISHGHL